MLIEGQTAKTKALPLMLPDDDQQAVLMSTSSGAGQQTRELTTRVLAQLRV